MKKGQWIQIGENARQLQAHLRHVFIVNDENDKVYKWEYGKPGEWEKVGKNCKFLIVTNKMVLMKNKKDDEWYLYDLDEEKWHAHPSNNNKIKPTKEQLCTPKNPKKKMTEEKPKKKKHAEPKPQGRDKNGLYWCCVCNTDNGKIPGKCNEDMSEAWYPYGGDEHSTDDFTVIKSNRFATDVYNNPAQGE